MLKNYYALSIMQMKNLIEKTIKEKTRAAGPFPGYREPLVGYARASDAGFKSLKELVGPGHLLPEDILPGARTVVAFFLPFRAELSRLNREHEYVAREWAEAYIITNRLIVSVCEEIAAGLAGIGVKAAWQQPTHNFDPVTLVSFWSHKHVAYLCGLGTFGVHHMLITAVGCSGRLGSLVLDVELEPTPRPERELCLYKRSGSCLYCVKACSTGALTVEGLDKPACFRRLLEVDARYDDLGLCDVCGKCATGPCAVMPGD